MSDQIIKLSPSGVIELIRAAIKDNETVFVGGSQGIGKSECAVEATLLEDHDVLMSLPPVEDPTAAGGCPWPVPGEGRVKMLPYGRLADALECKRPTVWILDDLPHAPPAVQISFMGLLWQPAGVPRQINGHLLPDHLKIMACGNLRKAGYGTHGMLEPVKGRFTLVEMVPNLNDFCNWGFDHGQQPEDMAFIRFSPDLLCVDDPNPDYVNQPNPRNWVKAFAWAHRNLSDHVKAAAIAGRVGAGPAAVYGAFLKMFQSLPNLDGMIADPMNAPIPDEKHLDVRYAICVGLAYKANTKNFDRIEQYAQRLFKAAIGDFAVLLCRDSARRNPQVMTTAAWIKLASSELGKLFTGSE